MECPLLDKSGQILILGHDGLAASDPKRGHGVLFVLGASCQTCLPVGQEHTQTIQ